MTSHGDAHSPHPRLPPDQSPAAPPLAQAATKETLKSPTKQEIEADPVRILELYDCCPKCGSTALEALTWKSLNIPAVTVGCWGCGWIIDPSQTTAP